jgi:hypothetical protein
MKQKSILAASLISLLGIGGAAAQVKPCPQTAQNYDRGTDPRAGGQTAQNYDRGTDPRAGGGYRNDEKTAQNDTIGGHVESTAVDPSNRGVLQTADGTGCR